MFHRRGETGWVSQEGYKTHRERGTDLQGGRERDGESTESTSRGISPFIAHAHLRQQRALLFSNPTHLVPLWPPLTLSLSLYQQASSVPAMAEESALVSFLSDPATLVGLGVVAAGAAYYLSSRATPFAPPVPLGNQTVEIPVRSSLSLPLCLSS